MLSKKTKVNILALDGSKIMSLTGDWAPTTVISGEKLARKSIQQQISLEISAENISIWTKQKVSSNKREVRMYIYNRLNRNIWCGEFCLEKSKTSGKTLDVKDKDYLTALSGMKSCLADLFMLQPTEFKILEAIDELDHKNNFSADNFLRLLYKVLREN